MCYIELQGLILIHSLMPPTVVSTTLAGTIQLKWPIVPVKQQPLLAEECFPDVQVPKVPCCRDLSRVLP